MREATTGDVVREMLAAEPPADATATARRVEALTALVFDLLAEVEALRATSLSQVPYRDAYRQVALLTHDASGPSSGWEKLLNRYYPRELSSDGRAWRETLLMRRLGFTPAEVEAYQREAGEAETYT
jgi:hypothetical protein